MDSNIVEMLHLELEPVGVFFGNTSARCDVEAAPRRRNCVILFLLSAAHGHVACLDEESCTCAGGAVGACFGDGFARRNPNIHHMLSQGMGDATPAGASPMMREGERFYCDSDVAMKWRRSLPLSERAYPRIVFAPLSRWDEVGTPDLVLVFAKPDQLSALVAMLGFHNGQSLNVLAPFGAACQSIMFAAEQIDASEPKAIMGLFDISQRRAALTDYLSLTMPVALWNGITRDLDKSCLTTHSWKAIEPRLGGKEA